MPHTIITVRGVHTAVVPPQRATARVTIGFESAQREVAFLNASALLGEIGAGLHALLDPDGGPVVEWSADQVRVWASRPWTSDGTQLPEVQHAQAELEATFSDFDELATWLTDVSSRSAVSVGGVDWTLPDHILHELHDSARQAALANAVEKATSYAAQLSLATVEAVAVSDPGMLGDQPPMPPASPMRMMATEASAGPNGYLDLKPKPISISVEVDARFAAS